MGNSQIFFSVFHFQGMIGAFNKAKERQSQIIDETPQILLSILHRLGDYKVYIYSFQHYSVFRTFDLIFLQIL